jgi:hypothetical protein
MLLLYIKQRIIYQSFVFAENLLPYMAATGTIVDPTSQVCSSAMLVLQIVENLGVRF